MFISYIKNTTKYMSAITNKLKFHINSNTETLPRHEQCILVLNDITYRMAQYCSYRHTGTRCFSIPGFSPYFDSTFREDGFFEIRQEKPEPRTKWRGFKGKNLWQQRLFWIASVHYFLTHILHSVGRDV